MSGSEVDIDFDALNELREALDAVDQRIVQTIAARQALVKKIGVVKAAEGHQTRDSGARRLSLIKLPEPPWPQVSRRTWQRMCWRR